MPYMNAPECRKYRIGKKYQCLDLLVDGYISGKLYYQEILNRTAAHKKRKCSCLFHAYAVWRFKRSYASGGAGI